MGMLAAVIAATPGTRAVADFADGLVGGIVGGAVSGIIVNESAKARERRRATTTRRVYTAPANTVARQQVIEEQTALNYFGFPAGAPDGVRGQNTRNAAMQFQAHMGYPVTGTLTEYERQFLISSYYRAQSNPTATAQLIAQRGMGTRGLLLAYRDEAAGMASGAAGAGTGAGIAPGAAAGAGSGGAADGTMLVSQPQTQTGQTGQGATASLPSLPNLLATGDQGPSLASHCNQISLITNSNGGFVTAATMGDPQFALNEQFCLARTYAIADGESLASNVKGVSNAQLEQQCAAFGPAMRDHVAALSLKSREEVLGDVRNFVLQSGQSPAQLSGTAKICLSVGYRTDKMDVALGSALLLAGLGEDVYDELIGHHLNAGFGTTRRPDLARTWYAAAITALESGSEPVFSPGNPGRTELIRKAAFAGQAGPKPPRSVQPAATLPLIGAN
ncbi:MAG: peptidoglycan-binding domain-containing protein [Roseovarius sp.]